MNDFNYSVVLQNLADDYHSQKISKEEYRHQRTLLLDKIDAEFNGRKLARFEDDKTIETNDSFFMKTVAFFKNKNADH